MIITTTDSVDGHTVVSYFPPVSASLVVGFTDTFGGKFDTF